MAGFDFSIPVPNVERLYAATLLRIAQRRAKLGGIALNFTWNKLHKKHRYNHYYVYIAGDLIQIEVFTRNMSDFLDGFQEGYAANNPILKKSLTHVTFIGSLHMALAEFHGKIQEFSYYLHSEAELSEVNSVTFFVPKASGLAKSMTALNACFIAHLTDRATSEQLAEQIHSSPEHLMRKLILKSKTMAYAELVSCAEANSLISDEHARSLQILKNLRRESKHRGQNISEKRLAQLLPKLIGAMHSLAAALRKTYTQEQQTE